MILFVKIIMSGWSKNIARSVKKFYHGHPYQTTEHDDQLSQPTRPPSNQLFIRPKSTTPSPSKRALPNNEPESPSEEKDDKEPQKKDDEEPQKKDEEEPQKKDDEEPLKQVDSRVQIVEPEKNVEDEKGKKKDQECMTEPENETEDEPNELLKQRSQERPSPTPCESIVVRAFSAPCESTPPRGSTKPHAYTAGPCKDKPERNTCPPGYDNEDCDDDNNDEDEDDDDSFEHDEDCIIHCQQQCRQEPRRKSTYQCPEVDTDKSRASDRQAQKSKSKEPPCKICPNSTDEEKCKIHNQKFLLIPTADSSDEDLVSPQSKKISEHDGLKQQDSEEMYFYVYPNSSKSSDCSIDILIVSRSCSSNSAKAQKNLTEVGSDSSCTEDNEDSGSSRKEKEKKKPVKNKDDDNYEDSSRKCL